MRFMAQEKKKGEEDTHAYITSYQSFILAWRSIVTAHSLLSQLKPTKYELKCLRSADKLSLAKKKKYTGKHLRSDANGRVWETR